MAKQPDKPNQGRRRQGGGADRHTPGRIKLSLHPHLKQLLQKLAEDNHSDVAEEIRAAIRDYLRKLGYLPPLGPQAGNEGQGRR